MTREVSQVERATLLGKWKALGVQALGIVALAVAYSKVGVATFPGALLCSFAIGFLMYGSERYGFWKGRRAQWKGEKL